MPDVYCPLCNNHVALMQLAVHECGHHPVYGYRRSFKIAYVVACAGCAMVSEVSDEGRLIDLGNVTLAELDAPFVPGIDEARAFIQVSAPTRRNES